MPPDDDDANAYRAYTPDDADAPQPGDATGDAQPGNGQKPAAAPRFKTTSFETIMINAKPAYLIKGIIPSRGLIVIWGPPKCGKSFWTLDISMHIALGREYRGRRVHQGPSVYCALEGGFGFTNRVVAWRRENLDAHHVEKVPFYLMNDSIDLIKEHAELIRSIRMQVVGDPAIVFIDTLNRALVGDENNSEDMAKFVKALDAIRIAFNCAVAVVHHCGTAGSRPRGHTSLTGANDAQIAISRDDDGIISAVVEHLKDGAASKPMASRLQYVDLGLDDDGEPIGSCVIAKAELADEKERDLPETARLALDRLYEVLDDHGEVPPANGHIPERTKAVPVPIWREDFCNVYSAEQPTARTKAFSRAMTKLQERKIVGAYGQFAWLAKQAGQAQQNEDAVEP
jgi:hypothetical protein